MLARPPGHTHARPARLPLLSTLPFGRKSIVRDPKPLIFAMPPSSSIGGAAGAPNPMAAPTSVSSTPTYVGCYADGAVQFGPWPRSIPNQAPGSSYTVTSCAQYAFNQGATLIGLQNGGQCWYGTDMAAATSEVNGCNPTTCGCSSSASCACGSLTGAGCTLCPNPATNPSEYANSYCSKQFGSAGCTSPSCGGECGGPWTNSIYTLM